jgi:hypothetical protein
MEKKFGGLGFSPLSAVNLAEGPFLVFTFEF